MGKQKSRSENRELISCRYVNGLVFFSKAYDNDNQQCSSIHSRIIFFKILIYFYLFACARS